MNEEEVKKLIEELTKDDTDDLIMRATEHSHKGYDKSKILEKIFFVTAVLKGTEPATTTNYGKFFIAPVSCTVLEIKEIHGTIGSDGSAVTLSVERLQGTEALDAGDNLMSGTFNLKATKDTVQTATLIGTNVVNLKVDDRLALVNTGTPTAVADLVVIVKLRANI